MINYNSYCFPIATLYRRMKYRFFWPTNPYVSPSLNYIFRIISSEVDIFGYKIPKYKYQIPVPSMRVIDLVVDHTHRHCLYQYRYSYSHIGIT